MQNNYIFVGFVNGAYSSFVGIKLVIMSHGGFERPSSMSGIYLSHDNDGSYDFGKMKIIKTLHKFNVQNIGMFDIDTLPVEARDLAIDLTEIGGGKLMESIIGMQLLSSLNIDFISKANKPTKLSR